ncbi:MAG: hypothetical protein IKZ39_05065, partial [Lachnospiraceae bacterium]|nr:hypothetical protein [Lachnospiraceae bacterium]
VNFNGTREAVVSGYAVADLEDGDGGGLIEIVVTPRRSETQTFSPVTYGYGNNVWFPYIEQNIFLVIVASALVFAGSVAIVTYVFIRKKIDSADAILYLAFVMLVDGLWIISESPIRQLIFKSPSYTSIFSFLLVESLAGFGVMYFNEIQEHRYEKIYVPLEAILFAQVLVNTILHFTGTVEFFNTLIFSHTWTVISILAGLTCMVIDIRKGLIKRYNIVSFGMLVLVVSAIFELIVFYSGTFKLGVFLGLGLMILLGTTAMQTISNVIKRVEDRRLYSEKMTRATFSTIAGTIDAKDEYTGGHSERVGEYAEKIATCMAGIYGFSEEDIERITAEIDALDLDSVYRSLPDVGSNGSILKDISEFNLPLKLFQKAYGISEKAREESRTEYSLFTGMPSIYKLKEAVKSFYDFKTLNYIILDEYAENIQIYKLYFRSVLESVLASDIQDEEQRTNNVHANSLSVFDVFLALRYENYADLKNLLKNVGIIPVEEDVYPYLSKVVECSTK